MNDLKVRGPSIVLFFAQKSTTLGAVSFIPVCIHAINGATCDKFMSSHISYINTHRKNYYIILRTPKFTIFWVKIFYS